jgi:hypothetical protein
MKKSVDLSVLLVFHFRGSPPKMKKSVHLSVLLVFHFRGSPPKMNSRYYCFPIAKMILTVYALFDIYIFFRSTNPWSTRLCLFLPYWKLRYFSTSDINDRSQHGNYLMGSADSEWNETTRPDLDVQANDAKLVKFEMAKYKKIGSTVVLHEIKQSTRTLPDVMAQQEIPEAERPLEPKPAEESPQEGTRLEVQAQQENNQDLQLEVQAQQKALTESKYVAVNTNIGASLAIHGLFNHKDIEYQPKASETFFAMDCIPSWTSSIHANTRSISKDRIYKTDRNGVLESGTFTTLTNETSTATFASDPPKVFPFEVDFMPTISTAPSPTPIVNSLLERTNHEGLLQSCPSAKMATEKSVCDAWKILLPHLHYPLAKSNEMLLTSDESSRSLETADIPEFESIALLYAQLLCQMQIYYNGLSSREDWLLLCSLLLKAAQQKGMCEDWTTTFEKMGIDRDSDLILTTYWLFMRVLTLREAPLEGYGRIATSFYALSKKFPKQWNTEVPHITEKGKKLLHAPLGLTVYFSEAKQLSEVMGPLRCLSRTFQEDSAQSKGTINNFKDFLDDYLRSLSDENKKQATYQPTLTKQEIGEMTNAVVDRFVNEHLFPRDSASVNPFLAALRETTEISRREQLRQILRELNHRYGNDGISKKHLAVCVSILCKSFMYEEKDGELVSPSLMVFRQLIEGDGKDRVVFQDGCYERHGKEIVTTCGHHYSYLSMKKKCVSHSVFPVRVHVPCQNISNNILFPAFVSSCELDAQH